MSATAVIKRTEIWYTFAKMKQAKKAKVKPKVKPETKTVTSHARKKPTIEKKIDSHQPVLEIKRHWFGLVSIYSLMTAGLAAVCLLIILIGDFWHASVAAAAVSVLALIALVYVVFVLFVFIGRIYNSNLLVINRLEVRQVAREALFMTKSSVLGLANVEDVTTVRNGVFAHVFNYGTLNIETAGEQENFKFRYCPNPEECARTLMRLREDYLNETKQDQYLR